MCGITGQTSQEKPVKRELIISLCRALAHRGPDDEGTWFSEDGSVGLGHRRLSILDLSALGNQPMLSPDGRFVIVYNGEIYNFRELRQALEKDGEHFYSNTDTEVLLRLWSLLGSECLSKLRGMYAFAIWDNLEHCLWLVRDPLGIKPLYFTLKRHTLTFASEIKALKVTGLAEGINPHGVGAFLKWGSIPAPLTIYNEIHSLPPATCLCWHQADGRVEKKRYWDYQTAWFKSQELLTDIHTRGEAIEWVRHALIESVRDHLVSDVPVGAFLSGGIDSTAVVSLMRQAGQREIQTFSIGFEDASLDESHIAVATAQHYGTRHHEWRVSQTDFFHLRSAFLASIDQPSIDGFNTFIVSRLANEHGMKVVTSGVGGDELFRGYPLQFRRLPALYKVLNWLPSLVRQTSATCLASILATQKLSHKGTRLTSLLHAEPTLSNLYLWSRELFRPSEIRSLFTDSEFAEAAASVTMADFLPSHLPESIGIFPKITMLETHRYLGSQLLADSDNFSMAHSLELRVPLVDKMLFEKIIALPDFYFHDSAHTPKPLLVAAAGDFPENLTNRAKQGFTIPFRDWLKEAHWDPASDTLKQERCHQLLHQFQMGQLHWTKRWAVELLDNVLTGAN